MACNGCSDGCNDCGQLTCGEGVAGLNGLNAFTRVNSKDTQIPLEGNSVTIPVSGLGQATGIWAQPGQVIYIDGAGYYQVVSSTPTTITATNLAGYGNATSGDFAINAGVSPAGLIGPQGYQGAIGTDGTDGTTILGYERDGGFFTSLTYMQIRGPYAIPANSWQSVGDTVRVKMLLFGGVSGGSPDASNHILYNFKMRVGTTDVVALPAGSAEYAIQSNFALNGILVEADLVAKSFSPFILEVVPKGNFWGLYNVGVASHTPGTSGLFLASTGSIGATQGLQYQPSVFVTSGIDPTVSNNFSIVGKHTVVGTGGGTTAQFACPYTLIELLKK